MEQKINELFKKERDINFKDKIDHEDIFVDRLYKELPPKKPWFQSGLKIAATILLLISIMLFSRSISDEQLKFEKPDLVLKNIAPDLEKIEEYYITNINQSISSIDYKNTEKKMVERYRNRLKILNQEHKTLMKEINSSGPNSMSITALINNLKIQLDILNQLNTVIEQKKNKKYEII